MSASVEVAGLGEQVERLASGAVSSLDLVDRSLRRIEAEQPRLNAFRVVCAEEALASAEAADARLAAGERAPLLGVPVAIKDDVDLAGHVTAFGCGGEDQVAARGDCEMVRRLRGAGAVIVGKTNAPEVGQWHFSESPAYGATRNPWNTGHTPGGSSGGAAAAVAAGLVAAAIGSDGAGSVRIPAAWTGLVGLKPQRGRISTWPDAEAFNGLTCLGPLTRSVGDAALLLDALAGSLPADHHQVPAPDRSFAEAAALPPERLRIALSTATPFGVPARLDPEIGAAIEATGRRFEEMGHRVELADPEYGLVGLGLVPRGMAGVHGWLEGHPGADARLEARTRVHRRLGRALGGAPLRMARAAEPAMAGRIGRIFERFDVVLTPTTAAPAPRIGELDGRGYWWTANAASAACPYAWPWNVTGWPALSLPAGLSRAGLPIGAQLLGRENGEATLLGLAGELEAAAGGWGRCPPAA